MKNYHRISESTRHKIEALFNAKVSVKEIARQLGYSKVTIYAELKKGAYQHRNSDWTETRKYSAYKAQRNSDYMATSKGAQLKIGNDHEFATFVENMILKGYSPEAVLGYIKKHDLKFKTTVCRVTLYSYIDKGIFNRISNKNLLRKSKKRKKKIVKRHAKMLPRIDHSIEKRPSEVLARTTFGHWELDSVIGTKNKGKTILSFTERKTRFQLVYVSDDKSSASTVKVLNRIERKLGSTSFRKIFKSFTCDNGTEFSNTIGMEFSPFTRRKRCDVWYCHAFCSSERGSNENQNGFIRRFVPKGTSISSYTPIDIKRYQDYINEYPRKLFDGKSSSDLFYEELEKIGLEEKFKFF